MILGGSFVMRKKLWFLLALLSLIVSVVFASSAFAASAAAAKNAYNAAYKKVVSVVDGGLNTKEALDAMLAVDGDALPVYERAHRAFLLGDLYYRIGDYDKCKEWTLKVLDTKELYDVPVTDSNKKTLYSHGLTAVVILANAAAEFGKPEDIDMIESRLTVKDFTTKVFIRYCWRSSPQNSLRTMLRFYKALACKNAGDLETMQEIINESSFRTGDIRVGNKWMALQRAAKLLTE